MQEGCPGGAVEEGLGEVTWLLAPSPHCWVFAPPPCPTFSELPVHGQLHWEGRGGPRPNASGGQTLLGRLIPHWPSHLGLSHLFRVD